MKLFKPFFLTTMLMMLVIFHLKGTNIDINANIRSFEAEISNDPATIEMFKDVARYRRFDFNRDLVHLNARNIGETMSLSFFDDSHYTAEILKAERNDAGRTVITAKILEDLFGYVIITVSDESITISAKVQETDEFFFASVKNEQAYIGQARLSEMAKDELPCGVIDEPIFSEHSIEHECETTRNKVEIDLLYVYTPAAAEWALNDWRVTDIHHLIDIVQAVSNFVMSNSETGIIFNIAHRYLTNYVEVDDWVDLDRFRQPNDGYMDEVHGLRNQYGADLMVLLAYINYVGGQAALLTDFAGMDPDYFAASINRVQQSSWSYTVVHEMGHNMGAHHHRDQDFQEGPNEYLGNYSSGWRGHIQHIMRTTVMAYDMGQYYADGVNAYRIPYFSSPLINLYGTIIGDAVLYDNARLLRETKGVTSGYRNRPENHWFDLSAESISGSSNISVNNPVTYTIRVKNLGEMSAWGYSVHLMEVGNFMPVASIEGSDLLPGEMMDFELIWTPSIVEQTFVWGHITWNLDEIQNNNNTSEIFVSIHPTGTFLSEDFDSQVSYFALGWDGRINSLSGIFENSGVDGSKALAMSVWENSEWQNAITPKIGPVSSNTVLSFSYRIINYTTDWDAPVTPHILGSGDITYIEVYSAGTSLPVTPIHHIHSSNHITSTDFAIVNLPLSAYMGEYINIRFNVERATGAWFFMLDDVYVLNSGDPLPILDIDPISHDFGGIVIGQTSSEQTFTITNIGEYPLSIYAIQISGQNSNEFNVLVEGLPWTITTGSMTFSVVFAPTSIGEKTASIVITHNAGGDPVFVPLTGDGTVSESDIVSLPTELLGNFPNPFNPETSISFSVGNALYFPPTFMGGDRGGSNGDGTHIMIEIFNIRGAKIRTLVNDVFSAGLHQIKWDGKTDHGREVGSGIYFYRMNTQDYSSVRRMLLLK